MFYFSLKYSLCLPNLVKLPKKIVLAIPVPSPPPQPQTESNGLYIFIKAKGGPDHIKASVEIIRQLCSHFMIMLFYSFLKIEVKNILKSLPACF